MSNRLASLTSAAAVLSVLPAPANDAFAGRSVVTGATNTVTAAANLTVSSVFTIQAGTFDSSAATITLSGSGTPLVVSATFTPSTSTVSYTSASAVNVAGGISYNNLALSGNSTKSPTGNITLIGNLTISAGAFDLGNFTADRTTTGGTLTVGSGTTLKIGGTGALPANFSTHSINAASTVEYSGAAQVVSEILPRAGQAQRHWLPGRRRSLEF